MENYVKQATIEGAFATDSFIQLRRCCRIPGLNLRGAASSAWSECMPSRRERSSIDLSGGHIMDDVKPDRLRLQQVKRETWRALTATKTGSQQEETEIHPTLFSKSGRDDRLRLRLAERKEEDDVL